MEDYSKLLAIASDQPLRPDLKFLSFSGGRVQATNILVWLDSESSLPLSGCKVPAAEFVRAMSILSPKGLRVEVEGERVLLSDERYSIKVPLLKDDFPGREFQGLNPARLFAKSPVEAFSNALPFVGDDTQAPFTKSVYCLDGVLYALQRAMVIGFDIRDCFQDGAPFDFSLTKQGLAAVVSYGSDVLSIDPSENGACIHFDDGSWIYTTASEHRPPDFRARIKDIDFASIPAIPEGFSKAIVDLDQLSLLSVDKKHVLFFDEHGIRTAEGEFFGRASVGSYKPACFSGDLLKDITAVANHIDLSQYPSPVPFRSEGGKVFGIFMGMDPNTIGDTVKK